jgi:transposase
MRIVLVNPYHVKQSKELDDGTPSKTDRKDPKTIAMLVKDGRYIEPYIPEGVYSELRVAMESRWSIVKQQNATKNKIKRWISIYFPEFEEVFGDWEGKAALTALKEYPSPGHVIAIGVDGIVSSWRKQKLRAVGIKRAVRLVEAASRTIGIKEGMTAGLNELEILLEDYEQKQRQYEKVMTLIETLAMKIPGFKELLEIKGVGLMLAAGFVSETGDINRFEHPRQIQKLVGLNLKETSSGKQKGKTQISKRGRKRLRYYLNFGIMPLLSKNEEFRQLHEYYTTREKNPLRKMQSLVALSNKLIRIFYAILTKQIAYDPEKMMSDIVRPTTLQAA